MIQMQSNMSDVVTQLDLSIINAIDIDQMTRLQASSLMAHMRRRIHIDGIATDGSNIGSYSPNYLKYTRPKYGRKEGSKVVLSLTRNMEQSMVLFPIENGTGIGYATEENLQKAVWCEETYGKPIFAPTEEERQMCIEIAQEYIKTRTK